MSSGNTPWPKSNHFIRFSLGMSISTGDCVLVRTGFYKRRLDNSPVDPDKDGSNALHPACMPLLREREVAMIGSDTPNDIFPASYQSIKYPVHVISLVAMGLPILDNANLEELAKECEKRGRWSFMINICPLQITGGTGSPVNPIAIF